MYPVVGPPFESSEECEVPLRYHYFQVHSPEMRVLVKVPSLGQIDLIKNHLYEIIIRYQIFLCVNKRLSRECPRGVMVKAMDCGIVVREFVLQSRYYVHFRTNTLGKCMNPLILPAMA